MHMTIMQIHKTILQTHMNIMQIQMKTIAQWGVPGAGHYANPHKTHYIIWVQAIMPASKPVQKFSSSRSSLESVNVAFPLCFWTQDELTKQSISHVVGLGFIRAQRTVNESKDYREEKFRSQHSFVIFHSCQLYPLWLCRQTFATIKGSCRAPKLLRKASKTQLPSPSLLTPLCVYVCV